MLREWVKHRYGVFDETGFDADVAYPFTFNQGNQSLANTCSSFTNST